VVRANGEFNLTLLVDHDFIILVDPTELVRVWMCRSREAELLNCFFGDYVLSTSRINDNVALISIDGALCFKDIVSFPILLC
jgi:hypothetical protein